MKGPDGPAGISRQVMNTRLESPAMLVLMGSDARRAVSKAQGIM